MSKALDIANNLSEFDGLAPAIDLSDVTATNITGTNVTGTNVNPTNLNIASTNHTFTVKGIDETVGTDTESGQFSIYNGATKLWGINESGWVQNPNLPAFHIRGLGPENVNAYVSLNTNLYSSNIITNNGNHWDNSTGIFTCPIDGHYFTYGNILIDNNTTDGAINRFVIMKNGTFFVIGYSQTGNGSAGEYYNMVTAMASIYCSAGDQLTWQATNGYLHTGGESTIGCYYLG